MLDSGMRASITIPCEPPLLFEVEFNLGIEKFWIDGVLIETINAIGGGNQNSRSFDVGVHKIEMVYSFKSREPYSKIFLDGELLTEHLFEGTDYMANKPSRNKVPYLVGVVILILSILAVGYLL